MVNVVVQGAQCMVQGAQCMVQGARGRRTLHPARCTLHLFLACLFSAAFPLIAQRQPGFTVDQILSLPQPDNLVASPVGSTIAWTFNERGVRNMYVASGPDFKPRRLTAYTSDDGQELTNL